MTDLTPLAPGFYWLRGYGDLGANENIRGYIGRVVKFIEVSNDGMIQVSGWDGNVVSVPRANLERG